MRVLIAPAFICERGHTKEPVDIIPARSPTGLAPAGAVLADGQQQAQAVVRVHEVEVVHTAATVTLPEEKDRVVRDTDPQ